MSHHQMLSVDTLRIAIAEYMEKNLGLLTELRGHDCSELEKYATEPLNWVRQDREAIDQGNGTVIYITDFILKRNPRWLSNQLLHEALMEVNAGVSEDGEGNILDVYIETC